MRQDDGILRWCYEVTTRTESAALPASPLLPLLASLRRVVHSDHCQAACLPGKPMADTESPTKKYIEDQPSETVIVVDNHLYPAEYLRVSKKLSGRLERRKGRTAGCE